jgi:glyoxylase-like metal-dependent hydrolase (beta-lactamase superfamily II)
MPRLLALSVIVSVFALSPLAGQVRRAPKRVQIADGVYLFITPPYGDVGLDGNAVAIVTEQGVVMFDSNGTPAASAAVLADVRSFTSQPVRYLVSSHWHWDHWYGAETYLDAFPDVRMIAHEKTRAMMIGPALAFNQPGIEHDLPDYIQSVEQRAATSPQLKELAEIDRFFLEQKKNVRHAFPNVTYSDRLVLTLGAREIDVLHYDRAVTPGDTFLYLPKEKILITGDLLVNPISFALSCYPTGWLRTLERMDQLDATVIVPGHGEPLQDRTLLHATMDVFRILLREGNAAKERGLSADEAKAAILPQLQPLIAIITGGDARLRQPFEVQLVDWYLHRVYDELDGPLGDDIAAIPRS